MIGFVDDSNACVNDFHNIDQSPSTLLARAQADAQQWNDLLCCSGGALEIPKCPYHLAHYGFTAAGAPVPRAMPAAQTQVSIQEPFTQQPTPLKYLSPYTARKTFGCYKSPSNNYKASLRHVTEIATQKPKRLKTVT